MRVFMLGWEFPPHISGGLGTACYGMTKGLDEIGVEVCFVLPTPISAGATSHVKLKSPADLPAGAFDNVEFHQLAAALQPYGKPVDYEQAVQKMIGDVTSKSPAGQKPEAMPSGSFVGASAYYGDDLLQQVHRYARLALELAESEEFDVIHAHDWMTYPAGLAVAAATHKPLVVHVHSTEFDRAGININQQVYDIERTGMHGANRVVCVSYLTRNIAVNRYGVPPEKIDVVYNAVQLPDNKLQMRPIAHNEKIVLFLGRVTLQKGPEYFLEAAQKVVKKFDKVRFVMAGSGDMISRCVQLAADLDISRYVTFTGFLQGIDLNNIFQMADLYVMPSVSEPFGIAPLEALSHNVPVIISKQSGVSEVLKHVLKVDFWDTDEMANKVLAVLRHPPLQKTLRQHGQIELRKFSWRDSAKKLKAVFQKVTAGSS